MKRITLQPEQLIVPGDEGIANESILKIYYRIFEHRCGNCLPRVIALHKDTEMPYYHGSNLSESYNENLDHYLKENPHATYFLLDGNHKAVAATLHHASIPVLELTEDNDITRCIEMCERGELFSWYIKGNTLKNIARGLGDFFCSHAYGWGKSFFTVKDKVERLVTYAKIPDYMIEGYLKRK